MYECEGEYIADCNARAEAEMAEMQAAEAEMNLIKLGNCETCKYGVDYGESVSFIRCEKLKRAKYVGKDALCEDYKSTLELEVE